MFKKIILSLICTIFSLNSYGMPVSIVNLKKDIEKIIKEIGNISIEKLMPTDLVIVSSRIPELANEKASGLNDKEYKEVKKHYEARYLLLIMWSAFDYYRKTSNPDLLKEILVQLQSFTANSLQNTLIGEEYNSYCELLVEVLTLMNPEGNEEAILNFV